MTTDQQSLTETPAPSGLLSHRFFRPAGLAGFALLVMAAKLLLIAAFGRPFPISDQWTEEGYALLAPWVHGQLGWQALLSSHWEHRFVLTRLLDIAMLEANGGIWNPLLQMVVNAQLHLAGLLLLLRFLQAALAPAARPALVWFATLVFCLPFSFENTLVSFQSQVYFLLLFSMLFLRGVSTGPAFGARWWLGLASGILAFFSLGSGGATLAAGAVFLLVRQLRCGVTQWRALGGGLLILVVALLAVHVTLQAPSPAWLRADSLQTFSSALLSELAWPLPPILAPLVYFPLVRFMTRQLRHPARPSHPSWSLFALGVWVLAQLAALGYGRGQAPLSSRYTDFFAVGLLLNFACLSGMLVTPDSASRRSRLTLLWTGLIAAGLLMQTVNSLAVIRNYSTPLVESSGAHIGAYLRTGDATFLAHSGIVQDGANPATQQSLQSQVQALLEAPGMRRILPPELVPENGGRQPAFNRWLLANLHALGLVVLGLGLVTAILPPLAARRPSRPAG